MSIENTHFRRDRSLRFYHEILGLERLHYGLWQDADPRTLEGVRIAQERYEEYLLARIGDIAAPGRSLRILDVGCGSGIMCEALAVRGYLVEGLSPDLHQREVFQKRLDVPFHLSTFQDFVPDAPFDIILMSESCQYVPLDKLFPALDRCLKLGGHLLVCDYFTLDGATGPLAKSGHPLSDFLLAADENGLNLRSEEDVTTQVLPTLDVAWNFVERYILPTAELASERLAERRPVMFRLGRYLLRRELGKAMMSMDMIDSGKFMLNKRYLSLLFTRPAAGGVRSHARLGFATSA